MKVGEIWTLKQHHETALTRYVKKIKADKMLFVTVEITGVESEFIMFYDLEHGGLAKWKRRDFVDAYQKVYGEL